MASVKGVNITKIDNGTGKIEKGYNHKLRVQKDEYEASSLAAGSDIALGRLPKGAVIHCVHLYHDALGASVTLSVGDDSDNARFISAQSASAAGVKDSDQIGGIGYELSATTDIKAYVGGAAATGTIKLVIHYSV